jgi:hypothetical protein
VLAAQRREEKDCREAEKIGCFIDAHDESDDAIDA